MIKVTVIGDIATAFGPFPLPFLKIISSLSGRKAWKGSASVSFDAVPANLRRLNACDYEISWEDKTGTIAAAEALENLPTQHTAAKLVTGYVPAMPWRDHQRDTLAISTRRAAYAHLHEMGLGKTAIAVAEAGMLHDDGFLTGVLVLAPKGVHRQWVSEQIPEHIAPHVTWHGIVWDGKPPEARQLNRKGLTFFTMNIDAIRTEKGFGAAERFLKAHSGKVMMVVDESHNIKSWVAQRTRAAWALGALATYRRIMTGTPIAKNVMDAWAQFKFLDVNILGHKYVTSFRARYCIMGGFEGRQIVGQRNTEEFYRLIAPHSFRLTKREALDLPPKIYNVREYDMSKETKRHYDSMKHTFMTALDSGEIVDVTNAASLVLRLQQIVCGYLPSEDGESVSIISGERLDVMMDIVQQVDGKQIIWAWFIEDGRRIMEALTREYGSGAAVLYRGSTAERAAAKTAFTKGNAQFFVSNQATGGVGTDGLQRVCQSAIYYSNSYRSLDRWQSEDRIDRMGMIGAASYFDIIANRSVDRPILRNLRSKKSISDLTLDNIRRMIDEM